METVQYYLTDNPNVVVSLLDCSKPFDLVLYLKPFNISRGLCPLLTALIIVMYSNV